MKHTHHAYDATRRSTGCGVSLDSVHNSTHGASGPQIGWHRHRKYHLAYSFPAGERRLEFEVTCKACLRKLKSARWTESVRSKITHEEPDTNEPIGDGLAEAPPIKD